MGKLGAKMTLLKTKRFFDEKIKIDSRDSLFNIGKN